MNGLAGTVERSGATVDIILGFPALPSVKPVPEKFALFQQTKKHI